MKLFDDSIVFKTQERYLQFQFNKILYCKSEGNYTDFYLEDSTNNSKRVCVTLKQIECILGGIGFLRIHQSFLVNKMKISSFCSKCNMIHISGMNLPIARKKRSDITKILLQNKIPDTKNPSLLIKQQNSF